MSSVHWVIVNCNSNKEAWKIGYTLLKTRQVACFDVLPRLYTAYFWPPKSGKVEKGKGAMLILVSKPSLYNKIVKKVKAMHSDKVPFIGSWKIDNVNKDYVKWLQEELK